MFFSFDFYYIGRKEDGIAGSFNVLPKKEEEVL